MRELLSTHAEKPSLKSVAFGITIIPSREAALLLSQWASIVRLCSRWVLKQSRHSWAKWRCSANYAADRPTSDQVSRSRDMKVGAMWLLAYLTGVLCNRTPN